MSTTVDGREIFPVRDELIPDLLHDLRKSDVPRLIRMVAADTLEALWLRNREFHRAVEADIARMREAEEEAKGDAFERDLNT